MKVTGAPAGPDPSRVPTREQQLQDVLLQQPKDPAGLLNQLQQLVEIFKSFVPPEAKQVQGRLQANQKGDTLAANFQKLPAAAQKDLNGILAKYNPAPLARADNTAPLPAGKQPALGTSTQQINSLVFKNLLAKQPQPPPAAQQPSVFANQVATFLKQPPRYEAATPTKPQFITSPVVGGSRTPVLVGRGEGASIKKTYIGGERKSTVQEKGKAIGPGSLTPYGTGNTLTSREVYAAKTGELNWGKDLGNAGTVAAGGDTRFLQARGRAYQSDTSIGVEAQAALVNANYGIRYDAPAVMLNGQRVAGFGTEATAEAFIGLEGRAYAGGSLDKNGLPAIGVGAEAFAGARTNVRAAANVDVIGLQGTAAGSAGASYGATGTAKALVGLSGASADVGGFAGASASVKGSLTVAGVGMAQKAEAWAGVGAKASASATFQDGKLKIGTELGVALGIGGSISVGVEIDPGKVVRNVGQFASTTVALVKAPAAAVAKAVGSGSLAAAKAVGTAAVAVNKVQVQVGKATVKAANAVASGVSSTANTVASGASSAAKSVAKVFSGW